MAGQAALPGAEGVVGRHQRPPQLPPPEGHAGFDAGSLRDRYRCHPPARQRRRLGLHVEPDGTGAWLLAGGRTLLRPACKHRSALRRPDTGKRGRHRLHPPGAGASTRLTSSRRNGVAVLWARWTSTASFSTSPAGERWLSGPAAGSERPAPWDWPPSAPTSSAATSTWSPPPGPPTPSGGEVARRRRPR